MRALLLLLATSCAAPLPGDGMPEAAGGAGEFTMLLGQRDFQDDAGWGDLDGQSSVGVIWSLEPEDTFLGWEASLLGSWEDTTVLTPDGPEPTADLDSTTLEGSIGVIKSVRLGERFRPYLGAGVSIIHVELEVPLGNSSVLLQEDDDFLGVYARAGLLFQWSESSFIGFDVRALEGGSGSITGIDYDTDYVQASLVFGASF